MALDSAR